MNVVRKSVIATRKTINLTRRKVMNLGNILLFFLAVTIFAVIFTILRIVAAAPKDEYDD